MIEAGVPILQLVAFTMPALACIIIFTGALRGAGDKRLPRLLTWIGFLGIRIPLAYFLMRDQIDLGSLEPSAACTWGCTGRVWRCSRI